MPWLRVIGGRAQLVDDRKPAAPINKCAIATWTDQASLSWAVGQNFLGTSQVQNNPILSYPYRLVCQVVLEVGFFENETQKKESKLNM